MSFPIPMTVFGPTRTTFLTESLRWTEPGSLVDAGVGERPTERYLVIVAVGDFVSLSNASLMDEPRRIAEPVLADIRAGHALFVLDLSNEGPNFDGATFEGFHRTMAENRLPLSSTMLVTQNRLMATAYRQFFGITGLSFGCHDFFVKLLIAGLDQGTARLFPTNEEVLAYRHGIDADARDFLCMNATPRWHRVLLYRYLTMHGHADRGWLSFHGANMANPKVTSIDQLPDIPAVLQDFGELIANIDEWMPREPIRFDTEKRMGNDLVQSLESWVYRASLYSIVTESDFFDGNSVQRITEKMVKAAGLGHPYIVVGNPRSINFMSELGFDTFAGVIDHDYDLLADPTTRMRAIFREIERQQRAIDADRAGWIAATRAGADHNVAHARDGLRQAYARSVERPLLQRLERFIDTGALDHPGSGGSGIAHGLMPV